MKFERFGLGGDRGHGAASSAARERRWRSGKVRRSDACYSPDLVGVGALSPSGAYPTTINEGPSASLRVPPRGREGGLQSGPKLAVERLAPVTDVLCDEALALRSVVTEAGIYLPVKVHGAPNQSQCYQDLLHGKAPKVELGHSLGSGEREANSYFPLRHNIGSRCSWRVIRERRRDSPAQLEREQQAMYRHRFERKDWRA